MYAFFSKQILKGLWDYGGTVYHVELMNGKAAYATLLSSKRNIKVPNTKFLDKVRTSRIASRREVAARFPYLNDRFEK
jgi:hypothetical protein